MAVIVIPSRLLRHMYDALMIPLRELFESMELMFGIFGAVAVLLLLLRFLRPSQRILLRAVYYDSSFRNIRSLGSALQLLYYLMETKSLYVAARLRVEVELLLPKPVRDDYPSRAEYRKRLKEWEQGKDRVLGELVHQVRHGYPTIDVKTCFDLHNAEDRIRRYFEALEVEKSKAISDRDSFVSHVKVGTGYIAPLYLLTGLLARFDDDWEPVINEYSKSVGLRNDPLGRKLRKIQTFLFDCWLLWGPSIPLCRCENWRGFVAMQYGYGDENNSVPVYGERLFEEFKQELVQRSATEANQVYPLAFQVSVTGRPRWGPTMRNRNFCIAQQAIQSQKTGGLVLENENIEEVGPAARRTYYSAYLWAMFVACNERGEPVFKNGYEWRGLFPFFAHGNIAEVDTYHFLKSQLAHEILLKIDRFIHGVLQNGSRLSFRYACAIDDSGCGEDLIFPDVSPKLQEIMQQLLSNPELRRLHDSGRISLERDPALENYAACHLPEIVAGYYEEVDSARVTDDTRA